MTLDLTGFIAIAVLVGMGCVLCYVGLWHSLRQAAGAERQAAEAQLSALAAKLKLLEERPGQTEATAEAEVAPETLVVIAAAVTAFLGKKVRIRSAKLLRASQEGVRPWPLQGRVLVQSSHHLRLKG